MKCTLFLYTESDNTKGKRLMSYFQGRLGRIAEVRGIKNILVRKQDFRYELRSSQCVVLVGTRQASSLIQNKQQEKDDDTSPSTAKLCTKNSQKTKNLSRTDLLMFTSLKEPRMTGSRLVSTKSEFFMWKTAKLRPKELLPWLTLNIAWRKYCSEMTSCTELKDLRECGKDFFMLKQKSHRCWLSSRLHLNDSSIMLYIELIILVSDCNFSSIESFKFDSVMLTLLAWLCD